MSLNFESFSALVDEIMRQNPGVDESTAEYLASLVGDTREIDENGKVIVRLDGRIIARINLS